jgi:protoporphyrinogen/coproporphyrinogen III oxidase
MSGTAPAVDAVVVGGGITGLAAARRLALDGASVTVLEPGRPGGKVQRSPFDGGVLDEAADAFLARVPEGVELCRQLGLGEELVAPAARRAYVWSRGALRPLPEGHVLGVPTDLDELAATGLVSAAGIEAARGDLVAPLAAPREDPSIGGYLRRRMGDEIVDRLVDPLVGGINAGAVDELSLAAVVPQLDAAARSGAPSLMAACRAQRAAADPSRPVFLAPRGGMGALVEALEADLRGRGVRIVSAAGTALGRDGTRWTVVTDGAGDLLADAVVLATPADHAGRLLEAVPEAREGARFLRQVPYASVALVALAVDRAAVEHELDGSGFLVPRVEGRTVTACSWTSSKWPHLNGEGTVWLRASVGRHGDDAALQGDDGAMVAAVVADLADTMGLRSGTTGVREARVTRWPRSFPQYRPRHLDAVAALDRQLAAAAPRLVVAGAALRGLGVPACIRQGGDAARRILQVLGAPS